MEKIVRESRQHCEGEAQPQTLLSSSLFAHNCPLPSLPMLVPPNHYDPPLPPLGSGSKYPRTGFMHAPNTLLQHPISPSLCRSLSPWGDPRACLRAPPPRWPRKKAKGVRLQELQFSIGLPIALAPLCLHELSLNPKPNLHQCTKQVGCTITSLHGQHSPRRRFAATGGSEGLLMWVAPVCWATQPPTTGEELLYHSSPQQWQMHLHKLPLSSGLLSICGAELLIT